MIPSCTWAFIINKVFLCCFVRSGAHLLLIIIECHKYSDPCIHQHTSKLILSSLVYMLYDSFIRAIVEKNYACKTCQIKTEVNITPCFKCTCTERTDVNARASCTHPSEEIARHLHRFITHIN